MIEKPKRKDMRIKVLQTLLNINQTYRRLLFFMKIKIKFYRKSEFYRNFTDYHVKTNAMYDAPSRVFIL